MNLKQHIRQISIAAFRGMLICLVLLSASAQEERKLIAQPQPAYPPIAKSLHLTGVVKVQVVIGTDGEIKATKVLGGNPLFVEATLETLKKWKYAPAQTETRTQLEFNFHE